MSASPNARFNTKHDWNTNDNNQHKGNHELGLLREYVYHIHCKIRRGGTRIRVESSSQEHVYHNSDDRWGSGYFIVLVWGSPSQLEWIQPFGNDQHIHPSKEKTKQHNLGDELKDEVHWLPEVNGIQSFHYDSQTHLDHTYDNCDLHLYAVSNVQIVNTLLPSGIKSYIIDTVRCHSMISHCTVWIRGVVRVDALGVTRMEELNGHRKELVVNESIVHRKEGHK